MKKSPQHRFYLIFACISVVGIALLFRPFLPQETDSPTAREGLIDLSGWNFDRDGIVKLNGEWAFYPHQLLLPDELSGEADRPHTWMPVPSAWNDAEDGQGGRMRAADFGTYRLRIKLPEEGGPTLALRMLAVRTSNEIYVDGKLRDTLGRPGETKAAYTPENVSQYIQLEQHGRELDLVIRVANFDLYYGGIGLPILLGTSGDIMNAKFLQTALDSAAAAVFLLLGLFFLVLFLFFIRDRNFLIFGLYFVCFSALSLLAGERILMQAAGEPWFRAFTKIKEAIEYFMSALILLFTYGMYRSSAALGRLLLSGIAVYLLYCLCIVALPISALHIRTGMHELAYISLSVNYIALIAVLLREYGKGSYGKFGRADLRLYIVSMFCLFLLYADSYIYYYLKLPGTRALGNFAVFFFVLLIASLFARRYFQMNKSLQRLTNRMKADNEAKDEFLLRTSRELNTPLHGIINLSQTMLETEEEAEYASGRRTKERLEFIRNTAFGMSNMVNDIVDLAKIKAGRLEVRLGTVDLAACVSVAFEVCGYLTKGKDVRLINQIAESARYATVDENRLMQILYNLIGNSLKHTERGSVVVGSERRKKMIAITIRDTGTGIPAERGEAIFLPYERGNNAFDPDKGGLGLGLGVSRELAELMRGTLALDWSVEREGSSFVLALPAAEDGGMATMAEPRRAPAADGRQPGGNAEDNGLGGVSGVLVVDHDAMQIEQLVGILSAEGYGVAAARSEEEAMRFIGRPDKPDILLLNVMLAGGDKSGYEASRKIRKLYSPIDLPILFFSARHTPADIEAGLSAGGNDFITKPFEAGEVRARIRTLLAMKRLAKEAAANEMAFLQSQIKPHFLYNALSTITSMCYTDAQRAGELLTVFSKYLRIIFHLDNREDTVPLRNELELVEAYVAIEKARFGDRVNMVCEIDDSLLDFPVMPLTVQPLVENAIRHGVSKKRNGGNVSLSIREAGGAIRIAVEDDGAGMTEKQVRAVFSGDSAIHAGGITNITRRVIHLTGAKPLVESEPGKGTKVTILLPVRHGGAERGTFRIL